MHRLEALGIKVGGKFGYFGRTLLLSWPRLVDRSGHGTQDNNKKKNKKTKTGITRRLEYKMPKIGVEPEWFIQ